MKRIILASTSPRRQKLMEMLGLPFSIIPSSFEEGAVAITSPHELVEYLSFQKAQDVATKEKDAIVIGADTVVAIEKQILGKPKTEQEAQEMLKKLRGKKHEVFTGYTIIDTSASMRRTNVVVSSVWFKNLSDNQINEYVKT